MHDGKQLLNMLPKRQVVQVKKKKLLSNTILLLNPEGIKIMHLHGDQFFVVVIVLHCVFVLLPLLILAVYELILPFILFSFVFLF